MRQDSNSQPLPDTAKPPDRGSTMPSIPVDTIAASDLPYEEFVRGYVQMNRPVVISDAVTTWPALSKWQPEWFKSHFGRKPIAVAYDKSMPFDEFIDAVLASNEEVPGPYMFRSFLHEHLPELLDDLIPQNIYAFPRRFASPLMPARLRRCDGYLKLLIGGPGSKFPVMHFDGDNANATVTEIFGDKEMILFCPNDAAFLYPNPKRPNFSMIEDLHSPDLSRYPLLAKARMYRTVIKPRDTVFIPSRWWHTARPLTVSVSVGTNILDGSNWGGFVDDACGGLENKPLRRLLKRGYLDSLGLLLSACEWLQYSAPRIARALLLPEKLSPVSAAVAAEPSAHQLKIRMPTG